MSKFDQRTEEFGLLIGDHDSARWVRVMFDDGDERDVSLSDLAFE